MDVLKIYCLGELQLVQGDDLISNHLSSKAKVLFFYLAVTRQPHLRSALADMFWGETSEERARNSLRVTLAELKKRVPAYLTVDRHTIAFDTHTPYWLDVDHLQRSLESDATQDLNTLKMTIELYRGDFLEGISYKNAPKFEDWASIYRDRLKKVAIAAHYQLANHHLQQEAYPAGIKLVEALLALEPWHEEAHRQLMLLFSRNGQRSAALRQYDVCKKILKDELNASPDEETTDLYNRIKMAGKNIHPNLPQPATPFVGRKKALETISKNLEHPDCRLLTLVGPGGIGKTRLALEVASMKRQRFLEGVYFVSLEGVDAHDFIPQAIIDALGISYLEGDDSQTQLTKYLRNKECLLVIDNFEPLLQGAVILEHILNRTKQVKLLVTSRERLNLRREWLSEVVGLDYPVKRHGTASTSYSAVQLFLNEAHRLGNAHIENKNLPYIHQICHLLEGMPLGIELAAGMTQLLSPKVIVEKLEEGLDFLATSEQDVPERHKRLDTIFEHSWRMLSAAEKESLMKLSVFRSGFDLKAAERVADLSLVLLEGLSKKSFIHRRASGRYYLHEFLRQSGERKSLEAIDTTALKNAHLDYFLDLAEQEILPKQTYFNEPWPGSLKIELNNFQTALKWALVAQNKERFLRLTKALWRFFDRTGHWRMGARYLNEALSICSDDDPQTQAVLLNGLAHLSWKQGKYDQAQALSKQSLRLFEHLKLSKGVVSALKNLARVALYQGNYKEANALYREALTQLEALDDTEGVSVVLCDLGRLAYYQGSYDQALHLLEQSLKISTALKDESGITYNFLFSAEVFFAQGDLKQAKDLAKKGLGYSEKTGDIRAMTIALNLLGAFHCHDQDYERAEKALDQSLALSSDLGDLRAQALSFNLFGFLLYCQGNDAEAKNFFQKSLRLRFDLQDKRGIAECFEGVALVIAKHKPQAAAVLLGASNSITETIRATLEVYDYGTGLSLMPLKRKLSQRPYELDWAKGENMSLNEAFAYALDSV